MKEKIIAVLIAVSVCLTTGCAQGTEGVTDNTASVQNEPAEDAVQNEAEKAEASSDESEEKAKDDAEAKTEEDFTLEEKETTIYFGSLSDKGTLPLYFVNGGEIPYVSVEDWAELMEMLSVMLETGTASDGSQYALDVEENGDVVTLMRENGTFSMDIDCANDTFYFYDYNAFLRWGDETLVDITSNVRFFNDKGEGEYLQRSEYNNELYGHDILMDLSEYGIDLLKDDDGYYVPMQTMSDILLAPKSINLLYNGKAVYMLGGREMDEDALDVYYSV